MAASGEDSDSDYCVEECIKPKRIRRPVNDESADLLGNFDDEKRQQIIDGTYEHKDRNPSDESDVPDDETEIDMEDKINGSGTTSNEEAEKDEVDDNVEAETTNPHDVNTNLSEEQLASLRRGAAKVNRYVLYATNLNFDTTKADLETYFGTVGNVKSVRIPKKRRGGYAFVEMTDLAGFQRGFQLHNTELQGRKIKVQLSEGGKKKSANKKNIMRQKNRKLAEMRNEHKTFTKSGKFYDKTLKKEKAKELLARKRWRKKPAPKST